MKSVHAFLMRKGIKQWEKKNEKLKKKKTIREEVIRKTTKKVYKISR